MNPQQHGTAHQRERERWRPIVEAGNAHCTELICLKPTRWIKPGTPWDLAHDRRTGGYLGPAHARCNRAEGARHGNKQRKHRRPIFKTRTKPKPSRDW